jgi:hypothetical protein
VKCKAFTWINSAYWKGTVFHSSTKYSCPSYAYTPMRKGICSTANELLLLLARSRLVKSGRDRSKSELLQCYTLPSLVFYYLILNLPIWNLCVVFYSLPVAPWILPPPHIDQNHNLLPWTSITLQCCIVVHLTVRFLMLKIYYPISVIIINFV